MLRASQSGLALALLLAACGGGGGATTAELPQDAWKWIDVEGTACADGSRTGLGVRTAPAGSADSTVLIFLMGGGACWGSGSNACPGSAAPGPFGQVEFDAAVAAGLDQGTILDRSVDGTPFAGATLVFIPYCTGDVHWGDSQQVYPAYLGTADHVWRHAGKTNLAADLDWLRRHLPRPARVVVAGSSAGGFGSLLAFDLARAAWPAPATAGYLVDDSGPPLAGDGVPAGERADWYAAWNLDGTLGAVCGDGCRSDLSRVIGALRASHPTDRIAYAGSLEDVTLANFLGYGPATAGYQAALLALVGGSFPASPEGADPHAFLVPGDRHALLADFATPSADRTTLPEWIRQMVHDEVGWTTLGLPP